MIRGYLRKPDAHGSPFVVEERDLRAFYGSPNGREIIRDRRSFAFLEVAHGREREYRLYGLGIACSNGVTGSVQSLPKATSTNVSGRGSARLFPRKAKAILGRRTQDRCFSRTIDPHSKPQLQHQ